MQLNLLPTIQQAIGNLLITYEPEFLRFGYRLFVAFATIVIAWHGIRMMFSHDGLGEQMFDFAKLLLFVSFGAPLVAAGANTAAPSAATRMPRPAPMQARHFSRASMLRAAGHSARSESAISASRRCRHARQPDGGAEAGGGVMLEGGQRRQPRGGPAR